MRLQTASDFVARRGLEAKCYGIADCAVCTLYVSSLVDSICANSYTTCRPTSRAAWASSLESDSESTTAPRACPPQLAQQPALPVGGTDFSVEEGRGINASLKCGLAQPMLHLSFIVSPELARMIQRWEHEAMILLQLHAV